jgi:bifunctional non-homologous end joining protein LigD
LASFVAYVRAFLSTHVLDPIIQFSSGLCLKPGRFCASRSGKSATPNFDQHGVLSAHGAQYEYQPCIPTRGTKVPAGPDWLHEIKHDGYRLIVQREGKRVRLLTRRGYDWSDRYPLIVEAALRLRKTSFVIDGEAVVLGSDGISDFDALHGGKRNADVRLHAFDLLADDGVDMRDQPLQIRKVWLGKLLKRSGDGILLNEHEAGDIGPRLFEQAAKWALRVSFLSIAKKPTGPAGVRPGSRSRTRTPLTCSATW